jgi:formate-nitrite transporter family protein
MKFQEPHTPTHELMLPRARAVYAVLTLEGDDQLGKDASQIVFSGIAAGTSISLSALAAAGLMAHLPHTEWARLVIAAGFPLGFLVVILGRQGLITESTVSAVLPYFGAPTPSNARQLIRFWGFVFLSNIIAAILVALFFSSTTILSSSILSSLVQLGTEQAQHGTDRLFFGAIAAGWLVALSIWTAPAAGSAKVLMIFALLYFVAVLDFPHVISGTAEIGFAMFEGNASLLELIRYVLIVGLGNIVGGVVLVAALNYMQVRERAK